MWSMIRRGTEEIIILEERVQNFGLFTIMILKSVNESIIFQSKKFAVCKVRLMRENRKQMVNFSMVFSLLKTIHSIPG